MSSLSSATFWSNSTDPNNTSSKLLHGFSQLDPDSLGSLAPGRSCCSLMADCLVLLRLAALPLVSVLLGPVAAS